MNDKLNKELKDLLEHEANLQRSIEQYAPQKKWTNNGYIQVPSKDLQMYKVLYRELKNIQERIAKLKIKLEENGNVVD